MHQMSVNGKYDKITRDDLLALATANNIKNPSEIIEEVRETASRWPQIAREADVPKEMIATIEPNMILDM